MYVKIFTALCGVIVNMELSKRIGENLKQARKDKGFTQKQLAEKLLMTQQQYSRFENGVFELNYHQILLLCELLEISPNDIFDLS